VLFTVFLIVIALILTLLLCKVTAHIAYVDGEASIKISFLKIKLYDSTESEKAENPDKNGEIAKTTKAKLVETSPINNQQVATATTPPLPEPQPRNTKKPRQKSLSSKQIRTIIKENPLDALKASLDSIKQATKATRKLLKSVSVTKLYIDAETGGEDAHDCAVNFGQVNIAVYTALGLFCSVFNVKSKKSIALKCNFDSNKSRFDFSCNFNASVITSLLFYLRLIGAFTVNAEKVLEVAAAKRKAKKQVAHT
jgi:hypothetical protein